MITTPKTMRMSEVFISPQFVGHPHGGVSCDPDKVRPACHFGQAPGTKGFAGVEARTGGGATLYVFTSLRGGPMTRRTVYHVVVEGAKAADIKFPVHPHMLPHGIGYFLANAGQDTRAIQLHLGHKTFSTRSAIRPIQRILEGLNAPRRASTRAYSVVRPCRRASALRSSLWKLPFCMMATSRSSRCRIDTSASGSPSTSSKSAR